MYLGGHFREIARLGAWLVSVFGPFRGKEGLVSESGSFAAGPGQRACL